MAFPEKEFRSWYKKRATKLGINPDPDDPKHFYDYRAAFTDGAEPDSTGHWPSKFKKEGHPNMIVDGVNTKTGEKVFDPNHPLASEDAALPSAKMKAKYQKTNDEGYWNHIGNAIRQTYKTIPDATDDEAVAVFRATELPDATDEEYFKLIHDQWGKDYKEQKPGLIEKGTSLVGDAITSGFQDVAALPKAAIGLGKGLLSGDVGLMGAGANPVLVPQSEKGIETVQKEAAHITRGGAFAAGMAVGGGTGKLLNKVPFLQATKLVNKEEVSKNFFMNLGRFAVKGSADFAAFMAPYEGIRESTLPDTSPEGIGKAFLEGMRQGAVTGAVLGPIAGTGGQIAKGLRKAYNAGKATTTAKTLPEAKAAAAKMAEVLPDGLLPVDITDPKAFATELIEKTYGPDVVNSPSGKKAIEKIEKKIIKKQDEKIAHLFENDDIDLGPKLPSVLKGAKPKYGYREKLFELDFESDVDKALYIVNATKKLSPRDAEYRAWLKSLGYSDQEIKMFGDIIKQQTKEKARGGNPDLGPIRVPRSGAEPVQLKNLSEGEAFEEVPITKIPPAEIVPSKKTSADDWAVLKEMGPAMTDNMYAAMWEKVQKDDITEGGQASAILQVAKKLKDAGALSSLTSFKKVAQHVFQIKEQNLKGKDYQNALNSFIDNYLSGYNLKIPNPGAKRVETAINPEIRQAQQGAIDMIRRWIKMKNWDEKKLPGMVVEERREGIKYRKLSDASPTIGKWKLIHFANEINPTIIQQISKSPEYEPFLNILDEVHNGIRDELTKHVSDFKNVEFKGLIFDTVLGRSKNPLQTNTQFSHTFTSPWAIIQGLKKTAKSTDQLARMTSWRLTRTLDHEFVHRFVLDHLNDFNAQYNVIQEYIGDISAVLNNKIYQELIKNDYKLLRTILRDSGELYKDRPVRRPHLTGESQRSGKNDTSVSQGGKSERRGPEGSDEDGKKLPTWVAEGLKAQGKNPKRIMNEIDAAQSKDLLATDPLIEKIEKSNPALAEKARRGDISHEELEPFLRESRKEFDNIRYHALHPIHLNLLKRLAQNPSYLKQFKEAGAGETISHADILSKAINSAPMTVDELANWKPETPSNTTDIARASILMGYWGDQYVKGVTEENVVLQTEAVEAITKMEPGYHNLTATPARGTEFQKVLKYHEEVIKKIKELRDINAPIETFAEEIKKTLEEKRKELTPHVLDLFGDVVHRIENYATAAKLSGVVTHEINALGSLLTYSQRAIERQMGALVRLAHGDKVEAVAMAKHALGSIEGFVSGFRKFKAILRIEKKDGKYQFKEDITRSKAELTRYWVKHTKDGFKVVQTEGPKSPMAVEYIFRLLAAADTAWKTVIRDSEIRTKAHIQAGREKVLQGLTDEQFTKRFKELVENPTETWKKEADEVAKEYTFQEDPDRFLRGIQQLQSIPGARFVMPFVQTPYNIARFHNRRSILGITSKRFWNDVGAGGVRQADAIARLSLGVIALGGAFGLVANGQVSGAYPKNKKERSEWEAEGKTPWSIKYGNKWIKYSRLQPIGLHLMTAAAIYEAFKENKFDKVEHKVGKLIGQLIAGPLDLPFLQGLSSLTDALQEPEKNLNIFLDKTIQGLFPTMLRDIQNQLDDTQRRPKGLKEAIQFLIPGQSQNLPAKIDVLGNEIKNPKNRILRAHKISSDAIDNAKIELMRNIGWAPPKGDPTLEFNGEEVELSGKMLENYQREMGRAADIMLETILEKYPDLSKFPPNVQKGILEQKIQEIQHPIKMKYKGLAGLLGPENQRKAEMMEAQ